MTKFGNSPEHTERHTGNKFKHQRRGEKKAFCCPIFLVCVLSVGLKRCILGDFVTLYSEEIFYTTQLLNQEFLLISGVGFDMSFIYHAFFKVGKF